MSLEKFSFVSGFKVSNLAGSQNSKTELELKTYLQQCITQFSLTMTYMQGSRAIQSIFRGKMDRENPCQVRYWVRTRTL